MNLLEIIARAPLWQQPPLAIAVTLVISLAALIVIAGVVMDFHAYHRQDRQVVKGATSVIETGSMAAFFVGYYLVIKLRLLELGIGGAVRLWMVLVGLVLVVLGSVFNIWGRLVLKAAWANQIKIYEGHELVTRGPFAVVRHPLYASLIWAFVGGSLVYANPLALALTLGVFVPMMLARSRAEDVLLGEAFGPQFEEYRRRTGRFFPKLALPAQRR